MRVLIAEARKDLLVAWSSKAFVIDLVFIPLVVILFLGYAEQGLIVGKADEKLPVADLDRSPRSVQLIDALRSDGHIAVSVLHPTRFTANDGARVLRDTQQPAVLVIPAGTGKLLDAGQHAELPVYTDPSQATRAGLLVFALQRAAAWMNARGAAVDIVATAAHVPPAAVSARVRNVVDAQLTRPRITVDAHPASAGGGLPSGFDEAVPGVALMWTIGFFARGAAAADDERRAYHTSTRTTTTRASRTARVFGHLVSSYVIVGLQVASLFLVGALVFGINIGNITALAVALTAFVAVPAAGSVALGALGIEAQLLELVMSIGMFVIGALSGAFVPLYLLPHWLEKIAVFSPLYWAISAVQDVMIRGAGLGDIVRPVVALAGLAISLMIVATARTQRARTA